MFENVLYAIRYPLATELFANKKVTSAIRSSVNSRDEFDGPATIDFGVAKTFPITIMRLPRWKRLIARSEALKSDLIFGLCFVGCSLL